jgi:Cys-tRNA(Pro) deacylase
MGKEKHPGTQAIRMLKDHGVEFFLRPYKYEEHGGTSSAAQALGVDEHRVVKTLVMEDDRDEPLLMLMHGDRKASTKAMARTLGVKKVSPCDSQTANRHTGYVVGGISPFGTRKALRVFVEQSIMDLPKIYINAGRRGLLVEIRPADLMRILQPVPVQVAIE